MPSIIENTKTSKRESYIEEQILKVIVPLEKEMEDATGVDIVIDYYFSLKNDWEDELWYEWTFGVKLPIFDEYRKSNSGDDQSLLKIIDVCKTLVEFYDDVYDDLDFNFKTENARIIMDFHGGNFGSLKIRDMSTLETFYYEEYGGKRYLHSYDTEYVLDKNVHLKPTQAKNDADNTLEIAYEKSKENIDFASKILGRTFDSSYSIDLVQEEYDFFSSYVELFGMQGQFEMICSNEGEINSTIDMLYWTSSNSVLTISSVTDALIEIYGSDYYVDDSHQVYTGIVVNNVYAWMDVDEYKAVMCWENNDNTVTIRWMI